MTTRILATVSGATRILPEDLGHDRIAGLDPVDRIWTVVAELV